MKDVAVHFPPFFSLDYITSSRTLTTGSFSSLQP